MYYKITHKNVITFSSKLLITSVFYLFPAIILAQGNAAPSVHLTYYFPTDQAILKMQKIKIVQSAFASYFEVNYWNLGYSGLQQTNDTSFGTPNIFISSMWDTNTAAGLYSRIDYNDLKTFTSRFGGEGDGVKTINSYNWKINTWYNIVNRSWNTDGRLYVATFINDVSTGEWFHTATFSKPTTDNYMVAVNDAFLENWNGTDPTLDGRFVRKAFFKDLWNLNANGVWEKEYLTYFTANNSAADISRDGIYHNSFNAYYDTTENAYCMRHGGNTIPSSAFNDQRALVLPAQSNQGASPEVTVGTITSSTVTNDSGVTTVNWAIDKTKTPQLSTKVEIINDLNVVVATVFEIKPEKRTALLNDFLADGNYTARITMVDIFNQAATVINTPFFIAAGKLKVVDKMDLSSLKIYPNPASSSINIDVKNLKSIAIIDIFGKVIFEQNSIKSENNIDVSNFTKGVYIVEVIDNEQKIQRNKIIIK